MNGTSEYENTYTVWPPEAFKPNVVSLTAGYKQAGINTNVVTFIADIRRGFITGPAVAMVTSLKVSVN
jgi:hypothetical protein